MADPLVGQSVLVERLRQQVLEVGRQVAQVERGLPGHQVLEFGPGQSHTVPSAGNTHHSAIDMEITRAASGVSRGEGEQQGAGQQVSVSSGSVIQGVRGFLSSLLGHVVGPQAEEQDDQGQAREDLGQPGVLQPGAGGQEAGSQDVSQSVSSRLIPSNFFDSPDVPARRYQPVRKGRPYSYKI